MTVGQRQQVFENKNFNSILIEEIHLDDYGITKSRIMTPPTTIANRTAPTMATTAAIPTSPRQTMAIR